MAKNDVYGDPLPAGAISRLGCARLMHPYQVHDLAFSRDDRLIASCADDILVSELETGKTLWRLAGHKGAVQALAFADDGRTLASVGEDATLRLWDTGTGKMTQKISLDHDQGRAVAFAGESLIVVGAYTHVHLVTIKGKAVDKLEQCEGWICDLVYDAGRHRAYVATERGLWRFALPRPGMLGTKLPAATEHRALGDESASAVALAPDGRVLAVGHYGKVVLWDLEAERPLRELPMQRSVESIAWSPDGQRLLTTNDSAAHLWNGKGELLRTFAKQYYDVDVGRFSNGGAVIATGGRGGDVRLWNATGEREVKSWPRHAGRVMDLRFSHDGSRLVSTSGANDIWVWDCDSGRPLHKIEPGEDGGDLVAMTPHGELVVNARKDGKIALYDAETAAPKKTLHTKDDSGWFRSLAVSADGAWVAACKGDETLHLWSVADGRLVWSKAVRLGSDVASLQFSPDGKHVAACGGGKVGVWSVAKGQRVAELGEGIWRFGFHDAETLVGLGGDSFLRRWNLGSREETGKAWCAGGGALVSGAGDVVALVTDRTVHFHALPGLEELGTVPCDANGLGMAFSGDGRRFAVVERARNILVWDVEHLATAKRGPSPVYPGAAALAKYELVLKTLPEQRFADVRIGDGCTNAGSPDDKDWDFLGIMVNMADTGRALSRAEAQQEYLDPPASPLVPMCGYICRSSGADIDNVYVVAVNEATGERLRGRLVLDRPTSGHMIPPPIFDDDGGDAPSDAGVPVVEPSRTGSWFTINLSEQVALPETEAAYRVHLEHAVVDRLKSAAVRVTIVGPPAKRR